MTKPRTGQSGNWDRERADRLQKDVERMQKDIERLTTEREWSEDRFPCDGGCVDAPEETCSRHGRSPADLWRIIGQVTAERDALTETAAEALASYGLANSKHHAELERADRLERLADTLAGKAVDLEDRARLAEAEVERLRAVVERVEALAEDWRYKGQFGWGAWQIGEGPDPEGYVMDHCASALRAALSGSGADTTDTQPTDQEDQS